jgi:hypothetical protein
MVTDPHWNDWNLKKRTELNTSRGQDTSWSFRAIGRYNQAAVLMFLAVLQDCFEPPFGRGASHGGVAKILSHPVKPVRIAMLAD